MSMKRRIYRTPCWKRFACFSITNDTFEIDTNCFAASPNSWNIDAPWPGQLRQRIAVVCEFGPWTPRNRRIYRASPPRGGFERHAISTRDAMARIAERSQAFLEPINNICFNAMLAGYMHRQLMIDYR